MMGEFDGIMEDHVRCVKNNENHCYYVSHKIQNKLISLFGNTVGNYIIKIIKEANYISISLVCTPRVSHQEQMNLILRCANICSTKYKLLNIF